MIGLIDQALELCTNSSNNEMNKLIKIIVWKVEKVDRLFVTVEIFRNEEEETFTWNCISLYVGAVILIDHCLV